MPYITKQDREGLGLYSPITGGELNYLISCLCANYIYNQGLKYQSISDVVGALEGAKQEFFHRVVDPYENLKRVENGDIPSYELLTEEIVNKTTDAYRNRPLEVNGT